MDDEECGEIGEIFDRGNRSTRRKPVPEPLCPPQIPLDLNQAETRAASVGINLILSAAPRHWGLLCPLQK
jgi:hypothetical protein